MLTTPEGKELKATWKASGTNEVEVHLPLKDVAIGAATLTVKQFGIAKPDELKLHTYSEAAKLDDFAISAGDKQGVLEGTRLDEVNGFELNGIHFAPAKLARIDRKDVLYLAEEHTSELQSQFHL